jgi:hypothetical protein
MTVLMAVLTLAHGYGMVSALQLWNENVGSTLVWLTAGWMSLMFCATVIFRILGMWCHHSDWWTA